MKTLYGSLAALALGTAAAAEPPAAPATSAPAAPAPTASGTAPAASPVGSVYNVELVVCRFTSALGSAEDWTAQAPAAAAPAGDADTGAAHLVKTLAAGELQLNDVESRLRANGTCMPVAHFGWSQTAGPWGSHDSLDLAALGAAGGGLSGTVQLTHGEFLHLALSLDLQVDAPPTALGAAPGTVFTLHDMHRVRFYERNYFDTPAFGVIALVTPAQGRRPGR